MKPSFLTVCSLSGVTSIAIGITLVAFGCSSPKEDRGDDSALSSDRPAKRNDSAPPRKLVDGPLIPTSPVNLLVDPGFGLGASQQGWGSFMAFYAGVGEHYALTTFSDSRSPAGFGGSVARLGDGSATDKASRSIVVLSSFPGGKGPFHAQVWASKSTVAGEPVDLPTDGSAISIVVSDTRPETTGAFVLQPDTTMTSAGRTWVRFAADITTPLEYGGFFLLTSGATGGHVLVAAPEITSNEIAVGQAVRSNRTALAETTRKRTDAETTAMRAYAAVSPR